MVRLQPVGPAVCALFPPMLCAEVYLAQLADPVDLRLSTTVHWVAPWEMLGAWALALLIS